MNFTEHAITFHCAEEQLLGILALPEQPEAVGVLIVVGGPQYRVGSHRQFLLLSRALAGAGYPTMRFDYRGMGDSTGDQRNFEDVNEDIRAAIDALRANCPQVKRVVLWGLCDAASANLLYWDATQDDARICGLVLVNPWVRSETTLASVYINHYYGQRLLEAEFWRKTFAGRVSLVGAIGEFIQNWLTARQNSKGPVLTGATLPFQKRMARGLGKFPGPVLLILSGNDYTAKEFSECVLSDPSWLGILESQAISRIDLLGADHTFSTAQWRSDVERYTTLWLNDLAEKL